MNFEQYSERSRGFLQAAQTLAQRRGHQRLTPEHLLYTLAEDPKGLVAGLLQAAGGDAAKLKRDLEAVLEKLPRVEGSGAGQVGTATFDIGVTTITYTVTDGSTNTQVDAMTVRMGKGYDLFEAHGQNPPLGITRIRPPYAVAATASS